MKRPVEVVADSCEFPGPVPPPARRIHLQFRPGDFAWDGVTPAVYKSAGDLPPGMAWREVVRHTLVGGGDAAGAQFQLRYFEIAPGGFSSLEKHRHVHAIVVLRGTGDVIVGTEVFRVAPIDVIYVPSESPHQFINAGTEPFGFLCPVDADRDRPQPLTGEELRALREIPAVRQALKIDSGR
ncbi:MAG TPA: cupin domain-containing protein [bacterium]|jgi:quercetin dioxygenase-like cupin family protein